MKKIKTTEFILILIALAPYFYLALIWNELPDKVPIHWNIEGEIDRYGSKTHLLFVPIIMPVLTYLLITFIPKIDPKNQLAKMGRKYETLKFILVLFMSLLAGMIIYASKTGEFFNEKFIPVTIAGLFVVLGNYMKTIRPNYFIGIRTPWTLENEEVWKKTHQMASYLWFWGGLFAIPGILLLSAKTGMVLFIAILLVITLIPVIYSYVLYKKISSK